MPLQQFVTNIVNMGEPVWLPITVAVFKASLAIAVREVSYFKQSIKFIHVDFHFFLNVRIDIRGR